MFSVPNKVAVITGGSRGLGLQMAEGLLQGGATKIYLSSRKHKACVEAAEQLNQLAQSKGWKGRAVGFGADCSNLAGCKSLFEEVAKHESKVDILIANAGATWGQELETHPEEALDKVFDLNVKGVFLTIQVFHKLLEKAGTEADPARVLITGSTAGIITNMSGGTYGYLASKAAVHHLAKVLAVELGPQNITVNVIAPGFFETKMAAGVLKVIGDELIATNPRRRLGVKEDIIGLTLFLCSPAANYINGVIVPLDGGNHLMSRV
jgi:NAD(P)-dependent dehydrogenase (short-subunit alcohol dehydrogenase family)